MLDWPIRMGSFIAAIAVGAIAAWWIDRQLQAELPRWHQAVGVPLMLCQWAIWIWLGLSLALPRFLGDVYPYLAIAIGLLLSILLVQACIEPLRRTLRRPPPRIFFDLAQMFISATVAIALTSQLFEGVNLRGIFNWVFTISTVGAVVIGFALQETLANFFAGIGLQLDAPFLQGDWIAVDECYGEVLSLNWRATVLRTIDREVISIPNSTIGRSKLVNYSRENAFAQQVDFGLSYKVPPSKVMQVLQQAAQSVDGVLAQPSVTTIVKNYADYFILYQVLYWSRLPGEQRRIQSQIRQRVWYALERSELRVPFPIRDTIVRRHRPPAKELPPDALEWLAAVDFLQVCESCQLEEFLDLGDRLRYTVGETICRVGEPGDRFYIILGGQVQVTLKPGRPVLARLGPGDYFGEIAVLTGQVRTATVMAVEDTLLLAFERQAFQRLIDSHPQMAERIAQVIAERQQAALAPEADREVRRQETASLFELVRSEIVKIFGRP
ncbi:mechanosensitive ion channel family protein [Synechococcus sp. PCC 7336]|uniref:mechanosensitive ion channel family protein n=1 Tax=Synechococcus sp. PCC 7336 TaxID=195250 RepID=UPI0005704D37|nr:mechanosensitive ion channel family protein [Synechococcus sp. PCC 7336]